MHVTHTPPPGETTPSTLTDGGDKPLLTDIPKQGSDGIQDYVRFCIGEMMSTSSQLPTHVAVAMCWNGWVRTQRAKKNEIAPELGYTIAAHIN
jgi:hypothetical protein